MNEESSSMESFNRTQNEQMKIIMKINKNYRGIVLEKYYYILNKIIRAYNNSMHRPIGMKPIGVNEKIEYFL